MSDHHRPRKARRCPQWIPRELRPVARAALDAHWQLDVTRRHHIRFIAPDGRVFHTSGTPSDWRSWRNFRSTLRRAGLDC